MSKIGPDKKSFSPDNKSISPDKKSTSRLWLNLNRCPCCRFHQTFEFTKNLLFCSIHSLFEGIQIKRLSR